MIKIHKNRYYEWLVQFVNITNDVWYFSGYNRITINDKYYYDHMHFTDKVGNMVLTTIYKNNLNTSDNFGYNLKPTNILDYIKILKSQFINYELQSR